MDDPNRCQTVFTHEEARRLETMDRKIIHLCYFIKNICFSKENLVQTVRLGKAEAD
ncbi:hypothetical protein D917_02666 [Trichinella nativa]|uniref:Uncharacterized protein n=1 Tax=Trichinella nativa TaxID=6335 RepID=A0A1Y3EDV5_9BILA|nr:hypothetical protein D917_02666 [Trichinella nativa]